MRVCPVSQTHLCGSAGKVLEVIVAQHQLKIQQASVPGHAGSEQALLKSVRPGLANADYGGVTTV